MVAIPVILAVVGLVALALVWTKNDHRPSDATRIKALVADRAISTPPPGARQAQQGPVLCEDSTPPYYAWHYAFAGPFDSVARFYSQSLEPDGWDYRGTFSAGSVGFDKRFPGWTASGTVFPDADGYTVQVDLESNPKCG